MAQEPVSRLNRRLVMTGLVITLAGSSRVASARQTVPTAVVEGDCEDEPGIKMLFDWRAGLPVYPSVAESGPQVDWVPSSIPRSCRHS